MKTKLVDYVDLTTTNDFSFWQSLSVSEWEHLYKACGYTVALADGFVIGYCLNTKHLVKEG